MSYAGNVAPRPRTRPPKPIQLIKGKHSHKKHSPSAPSRQDVPPGLGEPVYHSSAALGHQLETLKQMEFNAEESVLKALGESEMARMNFAGKVAEAVNVSKNECKYSGLVSVDVPVQEILAQEIGVRMARLKQPWRKPAKASEVPPPDIMRAFTPNLIVEEPKMDIPLLTSTRSKPKPCPPDRALDLYRHMCSWDS